MKKNKKLIVILSIILSVIIVSSISLLVLFKNVYEPKALHNIDDVVRNNLKTNVENYFKDRGLNNVNVTVTNGIIVKDSITNHDIQYNITAECEGKNYNESVIATYDMFFKKAKSTKIIDSELNGQKIIDFVTEVKKVRAENAYREFCKNVVITSMESQERGYGNYFDACITVENRNNTPISYIEFNINMYDTNGNLINTVMTNETNIQGNSKRIVKKMLPCGEGTWKAEITKITQG